MYQRQDAVDTHKTSFCDSLMSCNPPYIGRYVDYYDYGDENDVLKLKNS